MILLAIGFLSLVFIFGLFHTLLHSPTIKKIVVAWSQTPLVKEFSQNVIAAKTSWAGDKEGAPRGGIQNKVELKDVFATFDKNQDGFITKQELRESMRNVGVPMSEREVSDMVETMDSNGDGLIDFEEFCELFESVAGREAVVGSGGDQEGEGGGGGGDGDLKEAFDVFDGNGDGLITVAELGLVLSSLGMKEGGRLETCKDMISKVDVDGDGMVNFDEFKKMMKAGGGRLIAVS